MTRKQEILKYLKSVETGSLEHIYRNVRFSYYANWGKHLGAIMNQLVKQGKVERINRGHFRYLRSKTEIKGYPKQLQIF